MTCDNAKICIMGLTLLSKVAQLAFTEYIIRFRLIRQLNYIIGSILDRRFPMAKTIVLAGLVMNLIAAILIGYGRIFRSKKTIKKESRNEGHENVHEEKHRLVETRIAQVGAVLLSVGFATQIWGLAVDS